MVGRTAPKSALSMIAEDVADFTAVALAAAGCLLAVSGWMSRLSHRIGVPVSLLFLIIGMLTGSDGFGGVDFDRFDIAYAFGTLALVVILFSGGLHTKVGAARAVLAPAGVLATVGVLGVAALTALGARLCGLPWDEALLVGAIVSSTDAAAVFSVLEGVPLRRRVGLTLEMESGLNDPVAVILTTAMADNLVGRATLSWALAPQMLGQLVIGALLGAAIGGAARWLIPRARLSTPALYPALTLAVALIAYGVPSQLGGSGFLSVYVAGIALGNGQMPYQINVQRFHASLAWLAQIAMFLMLGLLVYPSELVPVFGTGLLLALYLAFVARPLVVGLCLLPFGYRWREIVYIAWVGLRGAVPVILATLPVLSSADPTDPLPQALDTFDVVFFIVVVGAIIPGATVRWLTRALGLQTTAPPAPTAAIDITSSLPIREAQLSFFIDRDSPAAGRPLNELALPDDATVMLVVRGEQLIAARGQTRLTVGDHAFVICEAASAAAVRACFGATATSDDAE